MGVEDGFRLLYAPGAAGYETILAGAVGTVILLIENSGPHFPSERRRNELSLNQQAQTTPLQLQSRHGDKSMQPGILHISLFMSPAPVFTLSPPPTLTHLRTTISKQIENLNKKHKDKQQLSIH